MRFSVIATSSVPDTATTRRLFDLHDLDDKSVSKVLFHRRKQQTGSSEVLRWDQRAIAGITLIQHSVDSVSVDSLTISTHSEEEMLQAFYRAVLHHGHVVSWDGERNDLPLIHFRTLLYGISAPPYWQALRERSDLHLDLSRFLSPSPADRPGLDETARKLALPGLLNHHEDAMVEAWLEGRYDEVQAFSDITALNVYLLALRLFATTGEITRHDNVRVKERLREVLLGREGRHLADFLTAWSGG